MFARLRGQIKCYLNRRPGVESFAVTRKLFTIVELKPTALDGGCFYIEVVRGLFLC